MAALRPAGQGMFRSPAAEAIAGAVAAGSLFFGDKASGRFFTRRGGAHMRGIGVPQYLIQ